MEQELKGGVYFCQQCLSADVCRDATAAWSAEEQKWELQSVQDQAYCNQCGEDTTIEKGGAPANCEQCGTAKATEFLGHGVFCSECAQFQEAQQ
jgi:hypothetical protein